MKISDEKLVEQAKSGNSYAFGKLVKRYQNKVLFLAYDLVGNYNDAQDVAQNTFLYAFRSIARFQEKSSFSTWLYRITTNAAIDFQRSKKRKKTLSLNQKTSEREDERELIDTLIDKDKPFDERYQELDLKNIIEQTTAKLPPQQRAAFVLKYFNNQPTDEIAKILKCDPVTVRGHILRASLKIRKLLKDEQ
ncbi:MAG TPA: sigma-70 family RNA polymerase sigma factor [bacterium]|nr:sigma-70 family RNA polymerase sigma factor [bacterium]